MSMSSWWENPVLVRTLQVWTSGLLGERRRKVVIEPYKDVVGFTNEKEIFVCATWACRATPVLMRLGLDVSGIELTWAATKGVAAHEVGHVRFSGELHSPPGQCHLRLRALVNALDDERVERGMKALFPGLRPYIALAKAAAWALAPRVTTAWDAILLWRFEHDLPLHAPSKMALEGREAELWQQVRPLVEAAWVAQTPGEVESLARKILRILGEETSDSPGKNPVDFHGRPEDETPEPLPREAAQEPGGGAGDNQPGDREGQAPGNRGTQDGHPGGGTGGNGPDDREGQVPGGAREQERPGKGVSREGEGAGQKAAPGEGPLAEALREVREELQRLQSETLVLGGATVRHSGRRRTEGEEMPRGVHLREANPDRLIAAALPLARRLVAALRRPAIESRERSGSGGAFSARDYIRTPSTPFLEETRRDAPRLALEVWCDSSGSMGFDNPKINNARLAVAALLLAAQELGISSALAFFRGCHRPEWGVAMEHGEPFSERPRRCLAGWAGADEDFLLWLMRAREPVLQELKARGIQPVVVILHDGYPAADRGEIKHWVRRSGQRGAPVIGVYLGESGEEAAQMRDIFPNVIVGRPETLPAQLSMLLRRLLRG
jgi:hypothetical protein